MKNVRLRAMEPEDLDLLYRIENDEELWDKGPTNVPYSRYVLHDYMLHTTGDIYTDKQVRLMIESEAEQTVVGMVDLVNVDVKNSRAEIGLVIEHPYRQKGYARQALMLLESYARQVVHLHQLYAVIAADNEAALTLFLKYNYRQTTHIKEWLFDGHSYHDVYLFQKIL